MKLPKPQDEATDGASNIQFTVEVGSHGTPRSFKVYVYPTLDAMYTSADRWYKKRGEEPLKHNYHGLTHSYNAIHIDADGSEVNYKNVGIIRLTKGYLHSYIIAHEIAHATLNIYQLDCVKDGDTLDQHLDPGNETFCHILSELEHNIVSKLHRTGAYDE
jgi:hypothetical protein